MSDIRKVRSPYFGEGIYQYEFRQDRISIARWDDPPTSTSQWVSVYRGEAGKDIKAWFLEGTDITDICVVPIYETLPTEYAWQETR